MVPSLSLLSCESSVSVKENPDERKKKKLFSYHAFRYKDSAAFWYLVGNNHLDALPLPGEVM